MDNSLTALWLVAVGVYLGLKVREWWERQPTPCAHLVPLEEPPRTAQRLCTCQECAPAYLQESPAEVQ